MSAPPLLVVTTVGTLDDARRIARTLVEQRLAACAQITPIESFYRWQGQVEHAHEYRVLQASRVEGQPGQTVFDLVDRMGGQIALAPGPGGAGLSVTVWLRRTSAPAAA